MPAIWDEPDRCVIRTSDLRPDTEVVRCSREDHAGRPCRTVGIGVYQDNVPGSGAGDVGDSETQ